MPKTLRINISMPQNVVNDLQKFIQPRKRSEFIAQATKEKLNLLIQQRAVEAAAGVWKDQNHPTLNTSEDMEIYLKETRGDYRIRQQRYTSND